jgi:hypothetical protein
MLSMLERMDSSSAITEFSTWPANELAEGSKSSESGA